MNLDPLLNEDEAALAHRYLNHWLANHSMTQTAARAIVLDLIRECRAAREAALKENVYNTRNDRGEEETEEAWPGQTRR